MYYKQITEVVLLELSPKKSNVVTLRLPKSLEDFVSEIAQKQEATKSEVIRAIIKSFKDAQ